MPRDRYIAERVEEAEIQESFKQMHKGKWVVYEPLGKEGLVFDYYDSEEEAKRKAKLLNNAEQVKDDIQNYAEERLDELNEEEINFLREYTGGTIEIEV